jgi:uracil-DNA glycosylase
MKTDSEEIQDLLLQTRKQLEHLKVLGIEEIQLPELNLPTRVPASPRPQVPIKSTPAPSRALPTPSALPPQRPSPAAVPASALFTDIGGEADLLQPSNETFDQIHAEIGDCTRCPLHRERTNVCHTEGNRKARLMFVGEAPGADEDAQARPFVGRAGQLLTKIIEAIGYKREEVLIGNINRCRPPGNRPPTPEEATTCRPYLLREIAIVKPEVIVVLGNTAMKNLLQTNIGITKLRGNFQNYKGIKVMPTFHPAYLLRDPSKKRETWEDLKKVKAYLDGQG